ncbi:hypothetical protein cyc_02485 [Cyclospora cayetanensis]|uniref:SPRY domain-containing protein n=1 Tax=Cyclospora cayetanensis TaxID=88456 RepID=A0A1D3D3Y1_9EIME|nr:hypothetical protein cyc_02485 [Cyclospora cayetanensis]
MASRAEAYSAPRKVCDQTSQWVPGRAPVQRQLPAKEHPVPLEDKRRHHVCACFPKSKRCTSHAGWRGEARSTANQWMHSEGMVVSGLQLGGEGLAVADTAVEQDRCVFAFFVFVCLVFDEERERRGEGKRRGKKEASPFWRDAYASLDARQRSLKKASFPSHFVRHAVSAEVCVLTPGEIHVGVCRLPWAEELQDAQSFISGKQSWMTPLGAPDVPAVEEGDIITCAVDQSDSPAKVNLLLNGMPLPASSRSGIHGEVWPAVFIRKGATIKWAFDSSDLRHLNVLQDRGYQPLMASRNLI